jgi:hypothetical protein
VSRTSKHAARMLCAAVTFGVWFDWVMYDRTPAWLWYMLPLFAWAWFVTVWTSEESQS